MQHQTRDGTCLGSRWTSCRFRFSCLSSRQSPPVHHASWPVLRMRHHHLPRRRFLGEKDPSVDSHPSHPSCHVAANVSIWGKTETSFSVDSAGAMVFLQAVDTKAPESLDIAFFHVGRNSNYAGRRLTEMKAGENSCFPASALRRR